MLQYNDGTEAKVGDHVKGVVRDVRGDFVNIIGTVVSAHRALIVAYIVTPFVGADTREEPVAYFSPRKPENGEHPTAAYPATLRVDATDFEKIV